MNEAKLAGILKAPMRPATMPGGPSIPANAERIVGLQPMRAAEIESGESSRLRYYAGRALSDAALATEQAFRARRLALRGQTASPGIVAGLEVGLERAAAPEGSPPGAGAFLHLLAGHGLTADGEDVTLPRPLRVAVRDLPVYATATLLDQFDLLRGGPVAAPEGTLGDAEMDRPLQPGSLQVRRLGPSLGELLDAGIFPPRVGVPVLQPVTLDMVGDADPNDPCALDPQNLAFEDWQRVDGCRLVWYAWPEEWVPLPDEGPESIQWRNLLAHTIFRVELGRQPGDLMPWEALGVPVALVAFDANWNALFADRHAVARDGGRPRARTALTPERGNVFIRQARIQQFNAQLAERVAAAAAADPAAPFAPLAGDFRYAPPVGFLPANAAQVRGGQQLAFPAEYTVEALPVPLEQLDAAIEQSAPLAPLDLAESDLVHLLVPVPQIWFEPNLLRVEEVDPAFQQAIDELVVRRGRWLARRLEVRDRAAALRRAVEGTGPGAGAPAIVLEGRILVRMRVFAHAGPSQDEPVVGAAVGSFSLIGRNDDASWLLARFAGFTGWVPAGPVTVTGNVADLPVGGPAVPPPPDAFPAPDPGALEDEELDEPVVEGDPVFGEPEKDYGTVTDTIEGQETTFVPEMDDLHNRLHETPLTGEEIDELGQRGLVGFIRWLEQKLSAANDNIDFGFLRVQSGIYRLRRQMLGTLDASRLATSPVLAAIAREESALTTKEGLRTYLNAIKGTSGLPGAPAPVSDVGSEGGPAPAGAPEPLSAGAFVAGAGGFTASGPRVTAGSALGGIAGRPVTGVSPISPVIGVSPVSPVIGVSPVSPVIGVSPVSPVIGVAPITGVGGMVRPQLGGGITDIGGSVFIRPGVTPVEPEAGRGGLFGGIQITPEVIVQQPPVVGATYEFRTTTVAERIKQPEANEVKATAVAAKFDTFKDIVNVGIQVDDLEVMVANADGVQERRPLGEIKGNLDAILQDPDPINGDEAAFFSATVDRLEHTVNLLRRVEGRVQEYRNAIARCRATLDTVNGFIANANARLALLDNKVAEARHDVAVARALLAEETARVGAINARRDKIVAEQVKFLMFRRPRATSARLGAPVRVLDAGLRPAALPACRASAPGSRTAPPELRRLIGLLREAPVRWFKALPPILAQMGDLTAIRQTVIESDIRAQLQIQALALTSAAKAATLQAGGQVGAPASTPARALDKVEDARRDRLIQVRLGAQQAAVLQPAPVEAMSWRQLYERGLDLVTVADLIEGRHGRSDLAQAAARRLDEIAQVAACLYAQMGRTPARLRLLWAERLSQFDASVSLQSLTVLPGWGDAELDRPARRDMQEMVDWLFDAVDGFQADAVEIMNDIVRSCILLASHAPVNQIVVGRVRAAAAVQVGSVVNVAVNTGIVPQILRIGAQAHIYVGNEVVAEAVVEDLVAGQAVTRITRAKAVQVQVDANAAVQFRAVA